MKMNNRKTILYVLDAYQVGGITTFVREHILILSAAGYQVILVGGRFDIAEPARFFTGARVYTYGDAPSYGLINKITKSFELYRTLQKVYVENEVDVVHFTNTWSSIVSLFIRKTWLLSKITTFSGAYHLEVSSANLSTNLVIDTKLYIWKLLQRFVLRISDQVITFSEYAKQILAQEFYIDDNVFIIPGFTSQNTKQYKKKVSSMTRIVNIGRAEPRKGIDILLRAVRILIDNGADIQVKISSPVDYYMPTLLHLYEELNLFTNVTFIHKSSTLQRNQLISESDIFVIPSRALETFGLTIVEALALGVPVVGTPCGAIPGILKEVSPQLISKDLTPESLAETIQWYINLPHNEKKSLSKKCRKVASKKYSKEVVSSNLLKIYRRLT